MAADQDNVCRAFNCALPLAQDTRASGEPRESPRYCQDGICLLEGREVYRNETKAAENLSNAG
jgi:hypothetical protein